MFSVSSSAGSAGAMTDLRLWNRVRIAPLPATRDGREFHRALADAHDLPMSEARDIEMEYRRFLYLAVTSDALRVAPPQVHEAWQLHAQSPEYAPFCTNVLGRALPLDNTTRRLGAAKAYRETRAAYAREFGLRPPRLYWPEGITPRLPRWLPLHTAVLGAAGALALAQSAPLYLAGGVGISLAVYALDLYLDHLGRHRQAFGDRMSDDLTFFLDRAPRR